MVRGVSGAILNWAHMMAERRQSLGQLSCVPNRRQLGQTPVSRINIRLIAVVFLVWGEQELVHYLLEFQVNLSQYYNIFLFFLISTADYGFELPKLISRVCKTTIKTFKKCLNCLKYILYNTYIILYSITNILYNTYIYYMI